MQAYANYTLYMMHKAESIIFYSGILNEVSV